MPLSTRIYSCVFPCKATVSRFHETRIKSLMIIAHAPLRPGCTSYLEVHKMANIKSAKKRILVTETRTARNKAIKSEVKTMVKKVYAAIDSKDQEAAKAALKAAISTLDKATTKGVYHKNTTSRKISRMQKAVNAMA